MRVFVITRAFDYEGESPIAVAGNLKLSKEIAEKEAIVDGYENGIWEESSGAIKLQFGATQYVIREEEVR